MHELKARARVLNEQVLADQHTNVVNHSMSQANNTNDSTDQSLPIAALDCHLQASVEGILPASTPGNAPVLSSLMRPLPTSPSSSNRNGNIRHRSASFGASAVRASALSPASVAKSPSLSAHSVYYAPTYVDYLFISCDTQNHWVYCGL